MMRKATGGFAMLVLAAAAVSTVKAQPGGNPDKVTVVNRKDNSTKTFEGTFQVSPDGFQVIGSDKKAGPAFAPDDVVKFVVGDLPGVDRGAINSINTKEDKKEWDGARILYDEQLKK